MFRCVCVVTKAWGRVPSLPQGFTTHAPEGTQQSIWGRPGHLPVVPCTPPPSSANGRPGCAQHQAALQEVLEKDLTAPRPTCPSLTPALLPPWLVFRGDKKSRVTCSPSAARRLEPALLRHTPGPFATCFKPPVVSLCLAADVTCFGDTLPLTGRLSPALNFSEPQSPYLNTPGHWVGTGAARWHDGAQ